MSNYFYQFLEPVSEELARTLKELEGTIYNSPRSMLTHSRTLIESLMEKVMVHENMDNKPYLTIKERIEDLDEGGLLTDEVRKALHEVRKFGNIAAHDVRQFRFSESLIAWEHIYVIVKWFVEVYGSHKIEVPEYVDPTMKAESTYDLEEINIRFKKIEELLKESIDREQPKEMNEENLAHTEIAATTVEKVAAKEPLSLPMDEEPGLTPVRTITYKEETLNIPHFLRDAFLLPQRFEESEGYLLRLNEEQQARLISELPATLDNLHERTTRRNETHTETFFHELKQFIDEEIRRRKLIQTRPGELFLFYNGDEIVVTEEFGKESINKENFTGAPRLIDQLNEDGILIVQDLPKELVIIGKYKGVGKGRVDNFFQQLKELQQEKIKELV
ncbi:DUF4145 domain-containing protein [Pseudogracilibacillus sp. SO30301A]|uniref:DUF4145 domain-containing protein n=1 Tax=Pseudogracilibacillus sp. SO30301A TaxID=3098291 RepID=UPI00300DBFFE